MAPPPGDAHLSPRTPRASRPGRARRGPGSGAQGTRRGRTIGSRRSLRSYDTISFPIGRTARGPGHGRESDARDANTSDDGAMGSRRRDYPVGRGPSHVVGDARLRARRTARGRSDQRAQPGGMR